MAERVTKAALEKMKKQLKELTGKRSRISSTIGEAREHGDLKENSAYHSAKDEQGLNEMRIRDLEARIENAVLIDETDLPKDGKIRIGSTVRVKALDTGDEYEYAIVPEADADVLEGKISTDSPIGEAVISCKKGQVVDVELPRGEVKFKILDVK